MPVSEGDFRELYHQVRLINSRITGIENTTEVILRADAPKIRDPFLRKVAADPLLGEVYLAVDGARSQKEIALEVKKGAKSVSEATISRKIDSLREDHLIILKEQTKVGRIYDKHPVVERNLRLARHVTRLLASQRAKDQSATRRQDRHR